MAEPGIPRTDDPDRISKLSCISGQLGQAGTPGATASIISCLKSAPQVLGSSSVPSAAPAPAQTAPAAPQGINLTLNLPAGGQMPRVTVIQVIG